MNRKFFLGPAFLLYSAVFCNGQPGQGLTYYLDANLSPAKQSKATILGEGSYDNGLFKLNCYNKKKERLLFTAHFTDSSLQFLAGLYTTYYPSGKKESEGVFQHNMRQGAWLDWDTVGQRVDSVIYKDNVAVVTTAFEYYPNGVLHRHRTRDGISNESSSRIYDSTGRIRREIITGNKRKLVTTYSGQATETDSIFENPEQHAFLPEGEKGGWSRFLIFNMNGQVASDNDAPRGRYEVVVRFIVLEDGSIEHIIPETSLGYGTEAEVIRVIKKSPPWTPAVNKGRNVCSFRSLRVAFTATGQ